MPSGRAGHVVDQRNCHAMVRRKHDRVQSRKIWLTGGNCDGRILKHQVSSMFTIGSKKAAVSGIC
jgi:hypothetical protein